MEWHAHGSGIQALTALYEDGVLVVKIDKLLAECTVCTDGGTIPRKSWMKEIALMFVRMVLWDA